MVVSANGGITSAAGNVALTNMPGYSVKGNSIAGLQPPIDIVAGNDQVLRRNGAGNLDFGTVNTAGITNLAVTYAKMQNLSGVSRLLGSSSLALPVTEITMGSGVTIAGNVLSATGSGGTVTSITAGTGLTSAPSPITTTGTISMANMPALTVKGNPNNFSTAPSDIAAGSDGLVLARVGTNLAFGQVQTLGIADKAVTGPKISIAGEANMGDMMYYDNSSTNWTILPAGLANNVLQSNGITPPTWQPGINITGDINVTDAGVATINPNSVLYGKIQPVSANQRILGSSTTTNDVQELTLGSGLTMVGNQINSSAVSLVSATAPLFVTSPTTTPNITIAQAGSGINGFLLGTDWTIFNNKQANIVAGSNLQYYRGDKTMQTLNTAVVPEFGVNQYFTNARVLATALAGLNTATATPILASDNVLQAFGKAQGQISAMPNVTIGVPANGLSIVAATQVLTLADATTSTPGALSAIDKTKLDLMNLPLVGLVGPATWDITTGLNASISWGIGGTSINITNLTGANAGLTGKLIATKIAGGGFPDELTITGVTSKVQGSIYGSGPGIINFGIQTNLLTWFWDGSTMWWTSADNMQ